MTSTGSSICCAEPLGFSVQFDALSPSLTLSPACERALRDKDGEVFVVWRRGQTDTELLRWIRAVLSLVTSNKV